VGKQKSPTRERAPSIGMPTITPRVDSVSRRGSIKRRIAKRRSSGSALSIHSVRSARSSFSSSVAPSPQELMIEGLQDSIMGLGATAKMNFRYFARKFAVYAKTDFRIVEFLNLLVKCEDVSEESFGVMLKVFSFVLTL
jgi:hypothetical protein